MKQLVLSDEQVKVLTEAQRQVELRDNNGGLIGYLHFSLFTREEIEEAKRRLASPGLCFTSEQVQSRLKALQQEWERTGGFDEGYMQEFLKRLDEADPGHVRPARQ